MVSRSKHKKTFVFLLASGAFYGLLLFYSDYVKIANNFQHIQFSYLPLILFIVFLSLFSKSLRQKLLLKYTKMSISVRDSFVIFVAGQSLLVTPGGLGTLIRSYFLERKFGYSVSRTIPLLLIEKFYDLIAILLIVSLFLFLKHLNVLTITILIIDILVVIIILGLKNSNAFFTIIKFLKKIPLLSRSIRSESDFRQLIFLLFSRKSLIVLLPFSVLCWTVDGFIGYFCILSFDKSFDLISAVGISLSSLFFGILSFIPAGLGVTDVTMIGFLTQNGISISIATSIVLYTRIFTTWLTTLLGFATIRASISRIKGIS